MQKKKKWLPSKELVVHDGLVTHYSLVSIHCVCGSSLEIILITHSTFFVIVKKDPRIILDIYGSCDLFSACNNVSQRQKS